MKKILTTFLRLIYLLIILAGCFLISYHLVLNTVETSVPPVKPEKQLSPFPDYTEMVKAVYSDYEKRKEHFHGWESHTYLEMEHQSACLTCHTPSPHKKDRKTRAFNNQHYRFMSCLACHLSDSLKIKATYLWNDFGTDRSEFKNSRYGLIRNENGQLSGAENFRSRIIPVIISRSVVNMIYTPYSSPEYQNYREKFSSLNDEEKNTFRRFAEKNMGNNPLKCADCHLPESRFPWSKLNFSNARIDEMTHSAIVGMVLKYEPFHFPPIYE